MTQQELEKHIQQWMRDFDKEAIEISGKMWVRKFGLTLDIDEYLQLRLNEKKDTNT